MQPSKNTYFLSFNLLWGFSCAKTQQGTIANGFWYFNAISTIDSVAWSGCIPINNSLMTSLSWFDVEVWRTNLSLQNESLNSSWKCFISWSSNIELASFSVSEHNFCLFWLLASPLLSLLNEKSFFCSVFWKGIEDIYVNNLLMQKLFRIRTDIRL